MVGIGVGVGTAVGVGAAVGSTVGAAETVACGFGVPEALLSFPLPAEHAAKKAHNVIAAKHTFLFIIAP